MNPSLQALQKFCTTRNLFKVSNKVVLIDKRYKYSRED